MWTYHRGAVFSVAVHIGILSLLMTGFLSGPTVATYRLPGTTSGVRTLAYFSSGSRKPRAANVIANQAETVKPPAVEEHDTPAPPPTGSAPAARAEAGTGDAVKSGSGQGNINIAMMKYFPYPQPDLSSLPHGSGGDVILDAVIDEHGKIASLTVLKGLGDAIDQSVIAIVQRWSYTPATKDGVPVSSEQELHFHYDRS